MDRDKRGVLSKLERAWEDLNASYAGLTEARMIEPSVVGEWSVKDVLAHVTTWEQEALEHLPTILGDKTPPQYSDTHGGIDAFNAKMAARKSDLPVSDVLNQLEEVHRQLVAYVESSPKEQLESETRFRRRLWQDTYGHYPEHAQAIRAWRAKVERR